jgi:hypothetical protein
MRLIHSGLPFQRRQAKISQDSFIRKPYEVHAVVAKQHHSACLVQLHHRAKEDRSQQARPRHRCLRITAGPRRNAKTNFLL